MLNPVLDHLSTKALIQKRKFSNFALITVWLGATIALFATCYAWIRDGVLPETTFFMAIIALMASFPVYSEKKRIIEILKKRV